VHVVRDTLFEVGNYNRVNKLFNLRREGLLSRETRGPFKLFIAVLLA